MVKHIANMYTVDGNMLGNRFKLSILQNTVSTGTYMYVVIIYVIMLARIPCNNLYLIISLNFTFALKTKENICIIIISELKDRIKETSKSL